MSGWSTGDGDNGADGFAHVRLGDLFAVGAPRDKTLNEVRTVQVAALVRLVPMTIAVNLINAALIVFALSDAVPHHELGIWYAAMVTLCAQRAVRAWRLQNDSRYAAAKPTGVASVASGITMLALLWLAPPLLWFDQATGNDQLMITIMIVGMMAGGSVTLATVPLVAIVYVGILSAGAVGLMIRLGSATMVMMSLVYGAALVVAIIYHARQFVGHWRARIELSEQSALIGLLREFDSSGSDWLWELDGERRLTYMSRDMAAAIGVSMRELIGTKVYHLLDPTRRVVDVSSGMRAVFDHFRGATPFRDIAVPTMDGKRWWSLSGKPLVDGEGRCLGWRGVGSDISDVRLSGSDSVRAARRDPLTGLGNRLLVREHLEEALLQQSGEGAGCSLFLIDLDRFKAVNDSHGHAVGDQLLGAVARRLEAIVGEAGLVGRLGGDEFAVVWRGPQGEAELSATCDALTTALAQPFAIDPVTIGIGATIGVASHPIDGSDQDSLTRGADLALYRAKEAGRGGHIFYAPWMHDQLKAHRLLETDLRDALANDAMSLAYQPIVDARSGDVVGHEALLRWRHPVRGDIPPDQFIPIIEEAGLIAQIGGWVIREACAEAMLWPEPMRVAVNISVAQLGGAELAATVVSALSHSGLAPHRLELEVTESIFLGDDEGTLASLASLRAIGVRLVLDDFGKGYSSFGYLGRADFSKIKIDLEFVRGAAAGNREATAIVRAIVALAAGLGLETTAEGVETETEAGAMRVLGCGQLQGFYFGRPVPAAALGARDRRSLRRRAG